MEWIPSIPLIPWIDPTWILIVSLRKAVPVTISLAGSMAFDSDLRERPDHMGFTLVAFNASGEGSAQVTVARGACADYAGNLNQEAGYTIVRGT